MEQFVAKDASSISLFRQRYNFSYSTFPSQKLTRGKYVVAHHALIDFIGLARPLVLDPEFPLRILSGDNVASNVTPDISTGIKALDRALMIRLTWYTYQLSVIGAGKTPNPNLHPLSAAMRLFFKTGWQNFIRTRN